MNITKAEFGKYCDVQQSGVTNMFDVITVEKLSGLTRDQIFHIMENYGELKQEFSG